MTHTINPALFPAPLEYANGERAHCHDTVLHTPTGRIGRVTATYPARKQVEVRFPENKRLTWVGIENCELQERGGMWKDAS